MDLEVLDSLEGLPMIATVTLADLGLLLQGHARGAGVIHEGKRIHLTLKLEI